VIGSKPKNIVQDADAITEPVPPPAWLSREAKAVWRHVLPLLIERRILTAADMNSLAMYASAMGEVQTMERQIQKEGHVVKVKEAPKRHPAVAIRSDAMTRATRLAAELGLTPVSRSRTPMRSKPNDPGNDPFAGMDI
jgi:P27 family predicted phage terminase small subunit